VVARVFWVVAKLFLLAQDKKIYLKLIIVYSNTVFVFDEHKNFLTKPLKFFKNPKLFNISVHAKM